MMHDKYTTDVMGTQEQNASSLKRAITIRVNEDVYFRYQELCKEQKRSMSGQGEIVIENFISEMELKNGTS